MHSPSRSADFLIPNFEKALEAAKTLMAGEIVMASSRTDGRISCWDLDSGAELLHFQSCSSPNHGLASVAGRFLASSQLRDSERSSSGSIFYWYWNKPGVVVTSFPAEPINPIVSHSEGTFIVGGGVSGDIYLWDVATGKLLKKWHAHYRAVTCLLFNDDESLLISGAEDGCVRVWSLFSIFNDVRSEEARSLYEYSFHEHCLKVTDIKIGIGGCNAIIVSASEDHTCKVWSLSKGKLVRNIVFPSIIDAIVLDPREHVFYAGGRDGKIYIARLCYAGASNSSLGLHIIGSFSDERSKAVTCLASSADEFLLVSGSEDGVIRVWNTRTRNVIRAFGHTKGSVNNVLVIRRTQCISSRASKKSIAEPLKGHSLLLPPPLEKYANSPDENAYVKVYISSRNNSDHLLGSSYIGIQTMENQIKELERLCSSVDAKEELERLKSEQQKSVQRWKRLYDELHQFCVEEIWDGSLPEGANGSHI